MSKKVPVWVVSEFSSMSSEKIHDDIKSSVRDYVEGEFGGDGDMNEYANDLNARSTAPEDFEIEGTNATVGDVLDTIDDLYNTLIDVNTNLENNGLDQEDVEDASASELRQVIDDSLINELRFGLQKLPEQVRGMFAQHHHDGIGGYGNEPSIGPSGEAMKKLYNDGSLK